MNLLNSDYRAGGVPAQEQSSGDAEKRALKEKIQALESKLIEVVNENLVLKRRLGRRDG